MIDTSKLPPHLYLSGGWKPKADGYVRGPLEDFSATMLKKFDCPRAGAFSYIHGIKEQFSSPEAENGTIGHAMLDGVRLGRPLPLKDPNEKTRWIANQMLPATRLMPRIDQCAELYGESTDWLDTRYIAPDLEPLKIQVKKDLEFRYGEDWFVYDYKTINKWERALDERSIFHDLQGILYPLDTMIRRKTLTVKSRWIYILMDATLPPDARPLDVQFHYQDSITRAEPIVRKADAIRKLIRLKVNPNDLEPNPCKCLEFYSKKKEEATGRPTGCPYRPEVGGPCSYHGPKPKSYGAPMSNPFPSFDFNSLAGAPPASAPPGMPFPAAPQNTGFVMPAIPMLPPEAQSFGQVAPVAPAPQAPALAPFPVAAAPPMANPSSFPAVAPVAPQPASLQPPTLLTPGYTPIPVPSTAPPLPPGWSWFCIKATGEWKHAPSANGMPDGAYVYDPAPTQTEFVAPPAQQLSTVVEPTTVEVPASPVEAAPEGKKPRKPRATKAEMAAREAAEAAGAAATTATFATHDSNVEQTFATLEDRVFVRVESSDGYTFEVPVLDASRVDIIAFARARAREALA